MRTDPTPKLSGRPSVELLSVLVDSTRTDVVVITARGDIDLLTSPLLQARLYEWIHHAGPDVVVDLTGVRYFGAAGITALVRAEAAAGAAGVDLLVVAVGRVVLRTLRITGMDSAFDLCPTLSDALGRLGSAGRQALFV